MIGTFVLVFAGAGAVIVDGITGGSVTHVGVGLTFAFVVMAMIYAVGDISGAHLNPAVTLGFVLSGRFSAKLSVMYVAAQLMGAILASAAHRIIFGNVAALGATLPLGSPMQSMVLEVILTAILMFTILCVSTGSKELGLMAGIAVGGVIGLEALFAGPISGASMNPARSIAPAIVSMNFTSLWVYLIAPPLGAAIAVPLWRLVRVNHQSLELEMEHVNKRT